MRGRALISHISIEVGQTCLSGVRSSSRRLVPVKLLSQFILYLEVHFWPVKRRLMTKSKIYCRP